MTREQLLLDMYNAQVSRSVHYEGQRALISNLIVAITVALVTFTTFDKQLSMPDLPLAILIVLLGVFGLVASKLHYERSRRHGKTAAAYREALAEAVPDAQINDIRTKAHINLINKYGKRKLRLHHLWDYLHMSIIIVGIALIFFSLVGLGP